MSRRRKRPRGRPRLDCEREPTGRPSRRKRKGVTPQTMDDVARNARVRVYGLTPAQSADQQAETVLGRLWLRGDITYEQRSAGERYREKYQAMRRAIEAPRGLEVSSRSGRPPDWDAPEFDRLGYTDRAIRAIADYEALRAYVSATADVVIVQDLEPATPDAMAILVDSLISLARKLGIGGERRTG